MVCGYRNIQSRGQIETEFEIVLKTSGKYNTSYNLGSNCAF